MFQTQIIVPIECYILFSGALVHCGSKTFIQNGGEIPSCVKSLFTSMENSYDAQICE